MHDTLPPADSPRAPRLALIAAIARNGIIGAGNRLPWRLPDDLRRFRRLTTGHTIIMGRRTWESIGTALPQRQNVVVSRHGGFVASGAEVAATLAAAIANARLPAPVFVIGGEALYRAALPLADCLYLTEIQRDFDGDARFPDWDRSAWHTTSSEVGHSEGPDRFEYRFTTYERVECQSDSKSTASPHPARE